MIIFKFKKLLDQSGMTRYKFQQLTKWNYKRINSFYFGKVQLIDIDELELICKIFKCQVSDIIEYKK